MKTTLVLLGLATSLAATSCKEGKAWTVLPAAEAAKLKRPCSRDFPKGLMGFWSPSPADIGAAEKVVDAAIAEALTHVQIPAALVPPKYHRQYAGFERTGRGVIYLNAVAVDAPDPGSDRGTWRDRALRLCDGGIFSFGAVFDPLSGRFDSFQFNSPLGKRPDPEAPEAAP